MILDVVADLTQYPKREIFIGIDDCGVPVFRLPVKHMAIAYA